MKTKINEDKMIDLMTKLDGKEDHLMKVKFYDNKIVLDVEEKYQGTLTDPNLLPFSFNFFLRQMLDLPIKEQPVNPHVIVFFKKMKKTKFRKITITREEILIYVDKEKISLYDLMMEDIFPVKNSQEIGYSFCLCLFHYVLQNFGIRQIDDYDSQDLRHIDSSLVKKVMKIQKLG